MKKRVFILLIAAACLLGLAACGIGHEHKYNQTVAEPTCTEQGYTLHRCECGKSYKDNYTDATGHTEVIEEAIAPTCTEKGRTEGKYCPDCGKIFAVQTVLPASGHTVDENNKCTVCGESAATKGLIYTLNDDGKSYSVTGHSAVVDGSDLYIASTYNGMPVTGIGEAAFNVNTWITSVTIPSSVTSIGRGAFLYCYSLESVKMAPNSVISIGFNAFGYCHCLTSITIPSSVTSIESAFQSCYSLESISVDSGNKVYYSVDNCIIESASKTLVLGCSNSVIPSDGSVTVIGDYAFSGCRKLGGVTIPDKITDIGDYAFSGCRSLTSITISSSVTRIGMCAFSDCYELTSVTGGASATEIGHGAFAGCERLSSITLSDKIKGIEGSTFSGCRSLTDIEIPSSVEWIKAYAFYGCGFTRITIPALVRSIGVDAFANCDNLTEITVDSANTTYHSAGNCIIEDRSGLLVIGCAGSVIPDDGSVKGIGCAAFSECNVLSEITIPESVTYIGEHAFYGCGNLTSIFIPSSVTSIDGTAFGYCSNLKTIIVDGDNAVYSSEGNCLIETASGTLIIGCIGSVIPSDGSITKIGSYAFMGCEGLTDIIIPSSVTSIGKFAFFGCINLTRVIFDGTVAEWKAIEKGEYWNHNTEKCTVTCSDGVLSKSESID